MAREISVNGAIASLVSELARIGGGTVTLSLKTGQAPDLKSPRQDLTIASPSVELAGKINQDTGLLDGYPVDEWLARQMWVAEQEVRPPVDGMTLPWNQLSQPERLSRLAQARWLIEHGILRVPS